VIVLAALAAGSFVWSNLRTPSAPEPTLARRAGEAGREGSAAAGPPAAAREAKAAGDVTSFRIGAADAEASAEERLRAALGASSATPRDGDGDGAGRGGDAALASAPAPARVDRYLERAVARFGQELDIPSLPRSRSNGSRDEALGDEGYVADVADAAMVEFLVRQELWETFHAKSQLVPWGYPVGRLREAWAAEVAALSVAERNRLLAVVEREMPQQSPPVMTKKIEYPGSDFEGQPSGVEIFE